jgi:tetratricopeptide (TPR) repeat protein
MEIREVISKYKNTCSLISRKSVKQALEILSELVYLSGKGDLRDKLINYESTYEYMLKYTLEGVEDPERHKVYNHLLISVLELADNVNQIILSQISGWQIYRLMDDLKKNQKYFGKPNIEQLEDFSFREELDNVLNKNYILNPDPTSEEAKKHKRLIINIFYHIWLANNYNEAYTDLFKIILKNSDISWYEKCLFISAVTLSVLRYFDENKFNILFDFYQDNEKEVSQRALVGLILALYQYDERLYLYPHIIKRLSILQEEKNIQQETEAIILQIIRSRETEKISRKLREEIIPEMTKLRPKLEDKLDLNKIVPDDFDEDKNPDWKIVFADSHELFEKVEEFTKLQMEGADVFMTAFSNLKHFDFFHELTNWFIPFYTENTVIDESLYEEKAGFNKNVFIEGLAGTAFLCNSDKYSFILNMRHMPQAQKTMMLELFNMELKGMNELAEQDELLDQSKRSKIIYTQYLQDLYRFYKLFPQKNEFEDIFKGKLDIYNAYFFRTIIRDRNIQINIAEYFFEKNYFEEALELYMDLEGSEDKSYEITEKIAYCYQKLENWKFALDLYLQAELFDKNRLWILKKIGLCYRKLKNTEKALEYYLEAEKIDPDNLYMQASIGHCYLDLKNYELALKHYFKVEYLSPAKKSVTRPIAWIYFVMGKLDSSKKYYQKLSNKEFTKYDYINFGHVEWCLGNRKEAIKFYKKSIKQEDNSLELFLANFNDDKEHLLKHGIIPDDIPIMLDYLQYSLKETK